MNIPDPIAISLFCLNTAPFLYYLAVFLGSATLLAYLLKIAAGVFKLFRKRINLKNRYGDNAWALVTGGSEGIGRQLASQLAKEGLNIVLLSRTESKLKKTQTDLQALYPSVKVEYIVADLSAQGQKEDQDKILFKLNNYDFSVVVNNAGMDKLALFQDYTLKDVFSLINLNCFSVCALTYKFAKIFRDKVRKEGKRCAIINVASIAGGQIPMPYFSLYAATKAYISKLTKNLAQELPEIDWLLLNPSEVSTSMTCFKNLDLFTISPSQCAEGTIDDLGHDLVTNGHISHKIQAFIYSVLPVGLFNLVWTKIFAPQDLQHRQKFEESKQEKKQ